MVRGGRHAGDGAAWPARASVATGLKRLARAVHDARPDPHALIPSILQTVADSLGAGLTALAAVEGRTLHVRQVHDRAAMGLAAGDALPLAETFCATMLAEALPSLCVEDARTDERFAALTAMRDRSAVAFSGVPLYHPDGRQYGTLFALFPRARVVQRDEAALLALAGRLIMQAIDADALHQRALHDALTDLPNRTLLHERLEDALRTARRDFRALALLLIGLDRFKEINDALGRAGGDLVLRQVGARLRDALRSSDTVARLDGDEFAVLLPTSDATGAPWVARKILSVLAEPVALEGRTLEITASIGIALCPDHGADASSLLRHADAAMRLAKRTGGGFTLYDAARDRYNPDRLAMEGELREAIAQDRLLLHYQPKVDVVAGRVCGVEALLRWPHRQRGLIPPDEFIPLAEQTGIIAPLSRWVLDTVLHQCRVWQRAGLDLSVAVNVSMSTLHDPHLPDTIAWLLRRYGIAPSMLTLEITESVLMADLTRAVEGLTRLAKLGVRISIDDFGTGYSSLAYLKRLPVDELKIDRSFVMHMVACDDDASIVSFTVGLGHSLGLQAVAEGVENAETWSLLAALGCDTAQGYYLSRPLPAAELEQWLSASSWGLCKATG